jgi:uncharacterized protein (TIGR02598 family)
VITKYSKRRTRIAFSLVEVVLALGVVTFACVILLGLLSIGLVTVTNSVGNTVRAQIIQAIINGSEVQTYTNTFTTNLYFDNEGSMVSESSPTMVYGAYVTPVPLNSGTYIYSTNTVVLSVAVTNKITPGVTNSFSLVWPNTGK